MHQLIIYIDRQISEVWTGCLNLEHITLRYVIDMYKLELDRPRIEMLAKILNELTDSKKFKLSNDAFIFFAACLQQLQFLY